MKGLITFCSFLLLSLPAAAVDGAQVKYVGGTAPGVPAGIVGQFDTTNGAALIFDYADKKLVIPYASVESSEYFKDVAQHLGVLPAVAVGLVKMRHHRHFFRITFRDQPCNSAVASQVVVFEVPKTIPRTLQAILEARSPHIVKPCSGIRE